MPAPFHMLTIVEKRELVGKILHLITHYEGYYHEVERMIEEAKERGFFKGIEFYPEPIKQENNEQSS